MSAVSLFTPQRAPGLCGTERKTPFYEIRRTALAIDLCKGRGLAARKDAVREDAVRSKSPKPSTFNGRLK
jgi:hypothetical protein